MSTTYVAVTYVGCRLDIDKVAPVMKVKAFPHNYPENYVVDPVSGKKLWREQRMLIPVLLLTPKARSVAEAGECLAGVMDFLTSACLFLSTGVYDGDQEVFLAPVRIRTDWRGGGARRHDLTPALLETVREQCRKVLEPIGLWDPSQFGLYTQCEAC